MGPWSLPAIGGVAWIIYPALTDEFKIEIGIMDDPEKQAPLPIEEKLELSPEQREKLLNKVPLPFEDKFLAAEKAGDFSHLESDWEKFTLVSVFKDGEHDDDDDDDDDEEDEEDEEDGGDDEDGDDE